MFETIVSKINIFNSAFTWRQKSIFLPSNHPRYFVADTENESASLLDHMLIFQFVYRMFEFLFVLRRSDHRRCQLVVVQKTFTYLKKKIKTNHFGETKSIDQVAIVRTMKTYSVHVSERSQSFTMCVDTHVALLDERKGRHFSDKLRTISSTIVHVSVNISSI